MENCEHDKWVIVDEEQYCSGCEETFADLIKGLTRKLSILNNGSYCTFCGKKYSDHQVICQKNVDAILSN